MIGKLVAIAPGSDLLVQSALGAALTRSLTRLYDIRVHRIEIAALLKAASKTVAMRMPLVLAVAGDALRRFLYDRVPGDGPEGPRLSDRAG